VTSSLSGKRSNRLSYRPGTEVEQYRTVAAGDKTGPPPTGSDYRWSSSARVISIPPSSAAAML
jgi:hypothetical protein